MCDVGVVRVKRVKHRQMTQSRRYMSTAGEWAGHRAEIVAYTIRVVVRTRDRGGLVC